MGLPPLMMKTHMFWKHTALSVSMRSLMMSHSIEMPIKEFFFIPVTLTFDRQFMTLTLELNLDNLPHDLLVYAEI